MKVAMKNTHLLAKRSRLEEVPLVAPETAGRAVALGPAELLVVLPSQEETAGGSGRQREAAGGGRPSDGFPKGRSDSPAFHDRGKNL